jgi:hypothetical protein
MIDSATGLVILGATLQAVPVGRAVVTFLMQRSRSAGLSRSISTVPSPRRNMRSSS